MNLSIRKATREDSKRIWQWRNDPVTCAMSLNSDPVPWDGHAKWYENTLLNPARSIWIGLAPDTQIPIGMVRFDKNEKGDSAEISINMAPDYRGRGLSRPFLESCIREIHRSGTVHTLTATIKPSNTASLSLFQSLGFQGDDASNTAAASAKTHPVMLYKTLS